MTDVTVGETINTGEIIEREEIISPPRRGRGRPRTVQTGQAIFTDGESEQKPRRGRRSSKLTGEHVAQTISLSSNILVMATQHPHWFIPPEECKSFAGQVAELLNKIPTKYVKAFVDMNGYVVIALGIYSISQPRIKMEQELRTKERVEMARARREELHKQEGLGWGIPTMTDNNVAENR